MRAAPLFWCEATGRQRFHFHSEIPRAAAAGFARTRRFIEMAGASQFGTPLRGGARYSLRPVTEPTFLEADIARKGFTPRVTDAEWEAILQRVAAVFGRELWHRCRLIHQADQATGTGRFALR